MQQRRGTAIQWTTADPVLAPGEIGVETDTNQFKLGDGVNNWSDLSYFKNLEDLGSSLDDFIPLTQKAQADGVATLDSTGNVPFAQLGNIVSGAPDLLNTLDEIAAAIGDNANFAASVTTHVSATEAHGATGAVVGTTNSQTLTNKTISGSSNTISNIAQSSVTNLTTDISGLDGRLDTAESSITNLLDDIGTANENIANLQTDKAPIASPTFTGTVSGVTKSHVGLGNVDNTSDANKPVSTATQTELDLKAPKAAPTFTGTLTAADVTITGDLTVSGTTTTVSTQDLLVTDPLIYVGEGNITNLVDLGIVSSFDDGTYQHTGLVRDASAGTWKLFKGVTDEPTTTINFAQGSLDALAVGALEATSLTVGDVSNTEISYLNGVTSAIQDQLDDKASLASPTFTGTVDFTSSTVIGIDALPSQTGNNGKYLTTNGTTASWATVSGGPSSAPAIHPVFAMA